RKTVWVFEHFLVSGGRTDAADDSFANARDDGFLCGPAHKTIQIRADRYQRPGLDDDAVLGHAINGDPAQTGSGAIDDSWVNGCPDSFNDGFAGALGGEVNGAGPIKDQIDAGLSGGNEGEHYHRHVAPGQKMRRKIVNANIQTRSNSSDAVVYDQGRRNSPQSQSNQLDESNFGSGSQRADVDHPNVKDHEGKHEQQQACNSSQHSVHGITP